MNAPLLLVADDCRTIRVIAQRYLNAMGFRCVMVENGIHALQEAKRQRFDALLLDLQMPDIDGQDVVNLIGKSEELNCNTPHLFISSESELELSERGIAIDSVIRKPLDQNQFQTSVRRATQCVNEEQPC